jgi:phosphoglucosamine mutase
MSLKFGTDGVRGPADELDDAFVAALGRAAAGVLGGERFVIGMDTRQSGPRIERALRAGVEAAGLAVQSLGVVPTPAVATVCAREGLAGAMISASHNPYDDNGIKFFAVGGLKLTDEVEDEIEAVLAASGDDVATASIETAPPVEPDRGRVEEYEELLARSIDGRRLNGLKVVVDCANGAASHLAPDVLGRLGADLTVIHAEPDGTNINAGCGSTDTTDLQAAVNASGADIGLAFDGDADRVLAVDEFGELVDGDQLIAMLAIDRRDRGMLPDDTVVVTVMSNLGFRLSMAEHAIKVVETQVGDRYILEALAEHGLTLGGEQSGHVIFRDLATTGDGLLTAIQVLDIMGRTGRFLSDLAASAMERLPQVLRNVRVAQRRPDVAAEIADHIGLVEAELGDRGRVLVRASGTEPVVRVMVEADNEAIAHAMVDRLVAAVERTS